MKFRAIFLVNENVCMLWKETAWFKSEKGAMQCSLLVEEKRTINFNISPADRHLAKKNRQTDAIKIRKGIKLPCQFS